MAVAELGETVLYRAARAARKEPVLLLSLSLAVLSMLAVPPSKQYLAYIDLKVLACLFALMADIAGFRSIGLFEVLSMRLLSRVRTVRHVTVLLVALPFFSSMLMTNDVGLLTFVPFTFVVFDMLRDTRFVIITVVLQTVAANIGSALTPMGNPQNLYLFSFFELSAIEFMATMAPLVVIGAGMLAAMLYFVGGSDRVVLVFDTIIVRSVDRRSLVRYSLLFILSILAVFDIIEWYIAVPVVALFVGKRQIAAVDHGLLLTFLAFFIFVGNLGSLPVVRDVLEQLLEGRVFLVSLLASQVLSNVPAALLLSPFTEESSQLMLGVNAGGCGTLIASLASVISFKLLAQYDRNSTWRYLWVFTKVNVLFVLFFIGFFFAVWRA